VSFLSGTDMVGGYGGADILKGCSIEVDEGEIAVIVGPNGAGKSTAMKALLGMLDLRQGRVEFRGKDGTTSPEFGPDSRAVTTHNLHYSHTGRFRQEIGPGKYDVIISHGPDLWPDKDEDRFFDHPSCQTLKTAILSCLSLALHMQKALYEGNRAFQMIPA